MEMREDPDILNSNISLSSDTHTTPRRWNYLWYRWDIKPRDPEETSSTRIAVCEIFDGGFVVEITNGVHELHVERSWSGDTKEQHCFSSRCMHRVNHEYRSLHGTLEPD